MAGGDILDIFTGRNSTTDVVRIQLQKTATSYQIRSGLLNDAGTWTETSWYDVPNSWSAVEIHYQAFANSGSLTLWLDDAQKQSLTFIDNDTRTLTPPVLRTPSPNPTIKTIDEYANSKSSDLGRAGGSDAKQNGLRRNVRETVLHPAPLLAV